MHVMYCSVAFVTCGIFRAAAASLHALIFGSHALAKSAARSFPALLGAAPEVAGVTSPDPPEMFAINEKSVSLSVADAASNHSSNPEKSYPFAFQHHNPVAFLTAKFLNSRHKSKYALTHASSFSCFNLSTLFP